MARTIAEKRVLKKLGITDFRHMTKDKIVSFASMLPRMDPEVAKKALEQFPEFASSAKEILANYKETIDKAVDSNDKSVKASYDICNNIIQSLKEQLDDKSLDFEQRMIIEDKMIEVAKMSAELDKQNKDFLVKIGGIGGAVAIVATAVIGAVLGTNIDVSKDGPSCDNGVIDADYIE